MEPPSIQHSLHPDPMYRWSYQDGLVAPAVDPITAPHDCMVPGCPGPENKRKLEAFPDLLAALEALLAAHDDISREWCCWCGDFTGDGCASHDCPGLMARAAIAKAREVQQCSEDS